MRAARVPSAASALTGPFVTSVTDVEAFGADATELRSSLVTANEADRADDPPIATDVVRRRKLPNATSFFHWLRTSRAATKAERLVI
jgi:hypothetical protein